MRFRFAALLGASLASFLLVLPTAAQAGVRASMCSSAEPRCERASLGVSKLERAPYDFDFDTGWVPGGSPVQVRLVAKLHSRVQVELQGTLDGTWPEPLTLTPKGTKAGGRITVDEGVEVEAQGRFSVTVAGTRYSWTGKIPGIPGVNLLAKESKSFDPWAWKGQLPAATITAETPTQQIAQVSLTDQLIPIPGISGGFVLDGSVAFSATYASLRIGFDEPNGLTPVDFQNPNTRLLLAPAPAVDTSVFIHGEVVRQATLHFIPGFYFTILGNRFSLPVANIPLDLPASKPDPWDFDRVDVHIPLPQISVVPDMELGAVPLDTATTVLVGVSDLGEEQLFLDATSPSALAFVDTRKATVNPGAAASVRVVISPDKLGKFDVPVVLASNDPMRPETTVHLRGTAEKKGATVGDGGSDEIAADDAPTPSGCGCDVVPRSSVPAWAGLGLVAVVFARRRRR